MNHALIIFVLTVTAFLVLNARLGYAEAYAVAYGAVVAIALSISATFFWLWRARSTPLALGMAFGWAGTCGVMGWWWAFQQFGAPRAMQDSPLLFVFVAAYFAGGILHFQVMIRSLGLWSYLLLTPMLLTVLISLAT